MKKNFFIQNRLLALLLVLTISTGLTFSKYITTINAGTFGLTITAGISEEGQNAENTLLPGPEFNTAIKAINPAHIVFGFTNDYIDKTEGTKIKIGGTDAKPLYAYQVDDTVYILSDSRIYAASLCEGMLQTLSNLQTVTLDNFDASGATNTASLFKQCGSLTTIYASQHASDSFQKAVITDQTNMFHQCGSLVGGQGTSDAHSSKNIIEYARIDEPPDKPGFFTDISQKPAAFSRKSAAFSMKMSEINVDVERCVFDFIEPLMDYPSVGEDYAFGFNVAEGYTFPEYIIFGIDDKEYEIATDGSNEWFDIQNQILTIPGEYLTEETKSVYIKISAVEIPAADETTETESEAKADNSLPEDTAQPENDNNGTAEDIEKTEETVPETKPETTPEPDAELSNENIDEAETAGTDTEQTVPANSETESIPEQEQPPETALSDDETVNSEDIIETPSEPPTGSESESESTESAPAERETPGELTKESDASASAATSEPAATPEIPANENNVESSEKSDGKNSTDNADNIGSVTQSEGEGESKGESESPKNTSAATPGEAPDVSPAPSATTENNKTENQAPSSIQPENESKNESSAPSDSAYAANKTASESASSASSVSD